MQIGQISNKLFQIKTILNNIISNNLLLIIILIKLMVLDKFNNPNLIIKLKMIHINNKINKVMNNVINHHPK